MITCPTSLEKKEIHLIKMMGLTYFSPPGEGGTTVSFSTTDSSKLDLEKLQMMVTQDKEPEKSLHVKKDKGQSIERMHGLHVTQG